MFTMLQNGQPSLKVVIVPGATFSDRTIAAATRFTPELLTAVSVPVHVSLVMFAPQQPESGQLPALLLDCKVPLLSPRRSGPDLLVELSTRNTAPRTTSLGDDPLGQPAQHQHQHQHQAASASPAVAPFGGPDSRSAAIGTGMFMVMGMGMDSGQGLGTEQHAVRVALRQRDSMVAAHLPAIITVYTLDGQVLHQNPASTQYLGPMPTVRSSQTSMALPAVPSGAVAAAPEATGAYPGPGLTAAAADAFGFGYGGDMGEEGFWVSSLGVLGLVFQYEQAKLRQMMEVLAGPGSVWQGIVRVPTSAALKQKLVCHPPSLRGPGALGALGAGPDSNTTRAPSGELVFAGGSGREHEPGAGPGRRSSRRRALGALLAGALHHTRSTTASAQQRSSQSLPHSNSQLQLHPQLSPPASLQLHPQSVSQSQPQSQQHPHPHTQPQPQQSQPQRQAWPLSGRVEIRQEQPQQHNQPQPQSVRSLDSELDSRQGGLADLTTTVEGLAAVAAAAVAAAEYSGTSGGAVSERRQNPVLDTDVDTGTGLSASGMIFAATLHRSRLSTTTTAADCLEQLAATYGTTPGSTMGEIEQMDASVSPSGTGNAGAAGGGGAEAGGHGGAGSRRLSRVYEAYVDPLATSTWTVLADRSSRAWTSYRAFVGLVGGHLRSQRRAKRATAHSGAELSEATKDSDSNAEKVALGLTRRWGSSTTIPAASTTAAAAAPGGGGGGGGFSNPSSLVLPQPFLSRRSHSHETYTRAGPHSACDLPTSLVRGTAESFFPSATATATHSAGEPTSSGHSGGNNRPFSGAVAPAAGSEAIEPFSSSAGGKRTGSDSAVEGPLGGDADQRQHHRHPNHSNYPNHNHPNQNQLPRRLSQQQQQMMTAPQEPQQMQHDVHSGTAPPGRPRSRRLGPEGSDGGDGFGRVSGSGAAGADDGGGEGGGVGPCSSGGAPLGAGSGRRLGSGTGMSRVLVFASTLRSAPFPGPGGSGASSSVSYPPPAVHGNAAKSPSTTTNPKGLAAAAVAAVTEALAPVPVPVPVLDPAAGVGGSAPPVMLPDFPLSPMTTTAALASVFPELQASLEADARRAAASMPPGTSPQASPSGAGASPDRLIEGLASSGAVPQQPSQPPQGGWGSALATSGPALVSHANGVAGGPVSDGAGSDPAGPRVQALTAPATMVATSGIDGAGGQGSRGPALRSGAALTVATMMAASPGEGSPGPTSHWERGAESRVAAPAAAAATAGAQAGTAPAPAATMAAAGTPRRAAAAVAVAAPAAAATAAEAMAAALGDEAAIGGGGQLEGMYDTWHEISAVCAQDPVTGATVLVVTQVDVTAKVRAERHLVHVMCAERRLLLQLFPRHVLQHVVDANPLLHSGSGTLDALPREWLDGGDWRPVLKDCDKLATMHPQATVLFADIAGFDDICMELPPQKVLAFLNDLFAKFDNSIEPFGVHKMETIGGLFIVAGGLLREEEDGAVAVRDRWDPLHAEKVFMFAKAMLNVAAKTKLPTMEEPVKLRIGIHTGPVMSGIVGTRVPRFVLFGDTVNTASRMQTTCTPGTVHVSEDTRALLPQDSWTPTGGVQIKGKGLLNTYVWVPEEHIHFIIPPNNSTTNNNESSSAGTNGVGASAHHISTATALPRSALETASCTSSDAFLAQQLSFTAIPAPSRGKSRLRNEGYL